jgi:hypothetical protein
MKIFETLNTSNLTNLSASAVVEVGEGEIADVDEMLKLVAGDLDHFGVDVKLMSTDEPPHLVDIAGRKSASRQFGFFGASEAKRKKRYYHVYVHKD